MSVNYYDPTNDKLVKISGGTLYADAPIGSWVKWDSENLPSGYLKAGDAIDQTIYPELYALYGSTVPYKADTSELDDFEAPFDPNIASIVTTGVTAQYDGFLYVNNFAPYSIEGSRSISINGVTVVSLTKSSSVVITQNFCLPIKKGDVIKGSASNYLGSWIFKYYKKSLIVKAKQVAVPFDVAEYIRNQNVLSDYEDINLSSQVTMQYDGFLSVTAASSARAIYVNGTVVSTASPSASTDGSGAIVFKKGDIVRLSSYYSGCAHVAYYKLRDYTGR